MNSRNPDFQDELGGLIAKSLRTRVEKQSAPETTWQRIKENLQEAPPQKRRFNKTHLTLRLIPLSLVGILMFSLMSKWALPLASPDTNTSQLIAHVNINQAQRVMPEPQPIAALETGVDQQELQQLKSINRLGSSAPFVPSMIDIDPPSDIVPHPLSQLKQDTDRFVENTSTRGILSPSTLDPQPIR